MDPLETHTRDLTRRRFFADAARSMSAAMGTFALGSLMDPGEALASVANLAGAGETPGPLVPHHRPKAKRVIYLHMEGAPSQVDLWDHKPYLRDRFNQDLPDQRPGPLPGRPVDLPLLEVRQPAGRRVGE
jgi:hypothetical protein